MECPRCQGSGVCADCQGSGQLECPTCGGTGKKKTPRGIAYTCKSCSGSGAIPCSVECSSCEGSGEITEKLQKTVREKYSVRFANTTPLNKVSNVLVMINFAAFVVTWVLGEGWSLLVNNPDSLATGEVWRLLSAVFLHVGYLHLFLNCWFLLVYCPPLEGLYGSPRFLLLYLICGVGGSIASWFGHYFIGGEPFQSAGASGALFGVGAAYIALHLRWRLFEDGLVRTWGFYLLGYLLVGFAADQLGFNFLNVDNWAHLGGFLTGFLWVFATPRPTGR